MAAGNGHMEDQFLVGFMHDVGEGQIGRDSKKAGKFLLRTQYGDGVPKSTAKAFIVGGGGHSQRRP